MTVPQDVLDHLDAALTQVRRFFQRPAVKQFYGERLDTSVDRNAYRVLRAIERASKTQASVSDVATLLEVDASTASRLIDRAVAAGYVERGVAPDDRRRSVLTLTAQGRRALAHLREVRLALLTELTRDWDPETVEQLADLLDRLETSLQRHETDATQPTATA